MWDANTPAIGGRRLELKSGQRLSQSFEVLLAVASTRLGTRRVAWLVIYLGNHLAYVQLMTTSIQLG